MTNPVASMKAPGSASGWEMNLSVGGQKRLVIVGATGMVGRYAVRCALENPAIGCATAIGRRKLGISDSKLKEVLHQCSTT
jgi:hypothetical protein